MCLLSGISALARGLVPRRYRFGTIARLLVERQAGGRVMSGPFRGMRFGGAPTAYPMLLGTYELELHQWIEQLVVGHFDRIVVVGAADGYYAVGLATRSPGATVQAFEVRPSARDTLLRHAEMNAAADRISIRELCDIPGLRQALASAQSPLLLMDSEGAETILLDPSIVPQLDKTTILVEMHEFALPGSRDLIANRFSGSHAIKITECISRDFSDLPIKLGRAAKILLGGALVQLMNEHRPARQEWLLIRPT